MSTEFAAVDEKADAPAGTDNSKIPKDELPLDARADTLYEATVRINDPFVTADQKAEALSQIAIIGMLTFGFGITGLLNLKPSDLDDFGEGFVKPFVCLMGISVCTSGIGMVIDSMMYYVLKQMVAHNQPKAIARLVSDPLIWQINNMGQYLIWIGILSFCSATAMYFFVLLPPSTAVPLTVVYAVIVMTGIIGTVYIFLFYLKWANWDLADPLGESNVNKN